MERTLEQLTAFLRHAGINPDGYGERIGETREEHVARTLRESALKYPVTHAELCAIIEQDKRENWPRIQAEIDRRSK